MKNLSFENVTNNPILPSKHLYGRVFSSKEDIISIPLDDKEISFLENFNIPFKKVKKANRNLQNIYSFDVRDFKLAVESN